MVEPNEMPPTDHSVQVHNAQEMGSTVHGQQQRVQGSENWRKNHIRGGQSPLMSDMLEQIVSFMPEIAPSAVIPKATSLDWLYNLLRKHYGCARTGRDMM